MKEIKFYYLCSERMHEEHACINNPKFDYRYFSPLAGMEIYTTMEELNRNFHNWCIRNHKDTAYIGEIVFKPGKHVELVTSYKDYKEKEK